jgi:formamidopyrimidine-DNA glycosylase
MSGRLKTVDKSYKRIKHDHFVLYFVSKQMLIYHDPRKFGFIDVVQTKDLQKQKYILSLGVDALSPDLTAYMLFKKISKSEVPIKQILLNQKLIAGIGNIYASEILFDSKISPLALGKDLEISLIVKLIKSTRKILKKAIKYGGSSIRDYRSTDGTLGNFQTNFKVYNKEGKKIGDDEVKKIVQYGRSTFYCPKLQNNK